MARSEALVQPRPATRLLNKLWEAVLPTMGWKDVVAVAVSGPRV